MQTPLFLSRRDMLCRVGAGFGSLGLAALLHDQKLLAAPAGNPLNAKAPQFPARAKHVIHLFMNGGPSQVDTFDPKPALVKYNGQRPPGLSVKSERRTAGLLMSPFSFKKCGQSGIEVSEIFPRVGGCIDDICVLRGMYTNIPNHEPALLMMNCGEIQPTRPSLGSWLLYGLGAENINLPGFVVLCPGEPTVGPALWSSSFLPGIFQGAHVHNGQLDPKKVIANVNNSYLGRDAQREQLDLIKAINQKHLEQRGGDNPLESRIQSLEMAFRMQFEAQDAFDISRESKLTRELYGSGQFADGCLLARRLIERGVRMVQLFHGNHQPWDDHADIKNHANLAANVDQPIAALIRDLKHRGLFEETLIIWGGEFGRTPASEGAKGRDHNSTGFTVWLAGGGVKGGIVHGATDEFGSTAVENRMHVHDLHATILHLMGINHEKLTYRYSGRDFRLTDVEGKVAQEIIA